MSAVLLGAEVGRLLLVDASRLDRLCLGFRSRVGTGESASQGRPLSWAEIKNLPVRVVSEGKMSVIIDDGKELNYRTGLCITWQ